MKIRLCGKCACQDADKQKNECFFHGLSQIFINFAAKLVICWKIFGFVDIKKNDSMLSQHRIARMKPLTNYNITNYLTNMKYRKNLH